MTHFVLCQMGPEMIIPIRMNGENQLSGGWRLPAAPDWPPSPPGVLLHPRVSELMGKKANLQNKVVKKLNTAPMNFGLPVLHNVRSSVFRVRILHCLTPKITNQQTLWRVSDNELVSSPEFPSADP